jgi:hypothetical protein
VSPPVKAAIVWVVGLLTVVPYAVYQLFFRAARDEYAFWIVLTLFWVFGYWSVVGPLLAALKVRSVVKAIQTAGSPEQLRARLRSGETREAVIELLAAENHIPRFLAARVYDTLARRFAAEDRDGHAPEGSRGTR